MSSFFDEIIRGALDNSALVGDRRTHVAADRRQGMTAGELRGHLADVHDATIVRVVCNLRSGIDWLELILPGDTTSTPKDGQQ